jgi:hypothetical protein
VNYLFLNHRSKIQQISLQMKSLAGNPNGGYINKGGVHHVVPVPGDKRFSGKAINLKTLNKILFIDTKKKICIAEPGVTFAELLKETLKVGLIPRLVPELEGITLGGAVAGCSVESMSYQYGGFHDSCLEYEIIKTDGEVMTCSPHRNSLVFEMMHGSYGTLGILTKLTFRLIKAKPFVKVIYEQYSSFDDFNRHLIKNCSDRNHEFVDAIIHAPNKLVLCLGDFVDHAPFLSNYRATKIFYKSTLIRRDDYLTTYDYCFRYDTECHWLTRTFPPLENPLVRFLLGKYFLGSTNLLTWSKRLKGILNLKKRPDVICDVFIPSNNFPRFFSWYVKEFAYFPLWVVPYRPPKIYPWLNAGYVKKMSAQSQKALIIDCAVYGKPNHGQFIDYSYLLEKTTLKFNGIKTLISRNHFAPQEFWSVYNRKNYFQVKKQTDSVGILPDIYNKFNKFKFNSNSTRTILTKT